MLMPNLARLFSYTRQLEAENVELKTRILDLELRLEKRTSYAFALSGRPTPEAVEARQAEAMKRGAETLPKRPNLRSIRGGLVAEVMAKREPQDEAMSARADRYVEKVKAN